MKNIRLLLVGNPDAIHIGAHLRAAAEELQIPVQVCDIRAAFAAPRLVRQFYWRMRGHRPPRLDRFNEMVLQMCTQWKPTHLVATGIAPLTHETLMHLHAQQICLLNYLTDDPWSPVQRAGWFLRALLSYDIVFTPRHANIADLRALGCARVEFLPFGYNPHVHFPAAGADDAIQSDVMFAGGADADRIPYLAALVNAGFDVRLYGGYWERFAVTRRAAHGHVDLPALREAVRTARVCLNLVRRSNRDDHVMRSYEVPAMRGCMLSEDTPEHRRLFGAEGEAVLCFASIEEMVTKTRWLLQHPSEQERLAVSAHRIITTGKHTYKDRLVAMFEPVN